MKIPQPPDYTPESMGSAVIERNHADIMLQEINDAAKELRQARKAWKKHREKCMQIMTQFATGVRK